MADEKKDGFFKRAGAKTKSAGKWVAEKTWTGGTKRKFGTAGAGVAAVGVGGYYAYRKNKARKAADVEYTQSEM